MYDLVFHRLQHWKSFFGLSFVSKFNPFGWGERREGFRVDDFSRRRNRAVGKTRSKISSSRARKLSHGWKNFQRASLQVSSFENKGVTVRLISGVLCGSSTWEGIIWAAIWWDQRLTKEIKEEIVLRVSEPGIHPWCSLKTSKAAMQLAGWGLVSLSPAAVHLKGQPASSEQGVQPRLEGISKEFRSFTK